MLVNIGGNKVIRGGNGIVDGLVDDVNWTVLMETMERRGFRHIEEGDARLSPSHCVFLTCYIQTKPSFDWFLLQ